MAHDPFWNSHQAREATMRHRPGALVRLGRHHRGWTLAVLGEQLGCSVATVSRLERAARVGDLALVRRAAQVVGVPSFLLATSLGLAAVSPAVATTVAAGPRAAEEDPMRRRTLLATATAGPAAALLAVDDALAVPPQPTGHAEPVDQALARARALYDHGSYRPLLTGLPNLLGNAHHAARTRRDLDHARLSAAYALAAAVLVKVGRYGPARLAADRATTYAHVSESALAGAAAARELAIVLRHQDRGEAARQLMARATADVEATGLRTEAQAAAYAQMLATSAYTAARSGDRTSALAMADEARRAARSLPPAPPAGRLFPITPAAVDLYAVGVHWALGDAGAALEAGKNLHPGQFPTAERRARMHTDLARAWWQWDRPAHAARELLAAARVSPGEVHDRPAIRAIAQNLTDRHPHVDGVRELAAAAHTTSDYLR
ncbi:MULTISPECIES: helix-turn-helix domain-containing protein [Streptomyces]|uniref:Helix-turn-helix domain-containing protein n=3 Tax=Streptomyces rimosus TaxID=1927 RepID=A0A8A1V2J1_STRR1|nr:MULTISPECIES: helix-turn-helix transcriptional regulator [Streptomyces]KOG73077.1 DNA-binding protein [Kitasatospora aureofaciens]MYT42070.1 helix-turn-helix domain-containing protein [Streptomyces sp. SID5471]KEF04846.1 DNA-binding protein [Streptomyces rimosus]KOT38626.1 DNA-binding protein [Streptomyces rimosus subsp. rimosus]KOT38726.1 DNA-binding protein [Streptomyces sp. NRRL WC-3701]